MEEAKAESKSDSESGVAEVPRVLEVVLAFAFGDDVSLFRASALSLYKMGQQGKGATLLRLSK